VRTSSFEISKDGATSVGIQEYMRHTDETDRLFPPSYILSGGMMHPDEASALGVDMEETLVSNYPYRRAYLPVNGGRDGAMHR
jgi:mannonate dehydratase